MGNSVLGDCASAETSNGIITKFYTSNAWITGRAEQQLAQIAGWSGVRKVAAFPDLHPGKYGPVGCAVLADRVYPQLIGNDIGCGMSLFELDLPLRKFKLEKASRRLRILDAPIESDVAERLEQVGLPVRATNGLGTIGGGNHFCEVQSLVHNALGLEKAVVYLLVHSGSRGFGNAVLANVPEGAFAGMRPDDEATHIYLRDQNRAVHWASLNRQIIAERAAEALRADLRLIVDAPHNLLMPHQGLWLHRKGAAVADRGIVPLAGSRETASFLMAPLGHQDSLHSSAHGAGRRYDRASMHGRVRAKRSDIEAMQRNPFGGRIICEDRDLLIEEAPLAYKSAQTVVADLELTGVAKQQAKFHPLVTFKKTRQGGRS